jgi:acetyl esterase/lipase
VLTQLQTDPTRIALWGAGGGGELALAAAQRLGPEKIRGVVTFAATDDNFQMVGASDSVPVLSFPTESNLISFKEAHRWLGDLLTDKQRGSKWKIRRKKKKK